MFGGGAGYGREGLVGAGIGGRLEDLNIGRLCLLQFNWFGQELETLETPRCEDPENPESPSTKNLALAMPRAEGAVEHEHEHVHSTQIRTCPQ